MTSLGFNQLHPVRIRSLPGAVVHKPFHRDERSPETTVTKQVITPRPSTNPPLWNAALHNLPTPVVECGNAKSTYVIRRRCFENFVEYSGTNTLQLRMSFSPKWKPCILNYRLFTAPSKATALKIQKVT